MLKLLSFTIAVLLGCSSLQNTAKNSQNMEDIIKEIIDKKPQNQAEFEAILGVNLKRNATLSSRYFDNLQGKGDKNTTFENVELRLPIPNSGATNGSIIFFDFAENLAFSKDKIWLKYGVAVEMGIAPPKTFLKPII